MSAVKQREEPLANVVDGVAETIGNGPHLDFTCFMDAVAAEASEQGVKLIAKRKKSCCKRRWHFGMKPLNQ